MPRDDHLDLPAGTWVADPASSSLALVSARARGRLTAFAARLSVGPAGARRLTGVADPESIVLDAGDRVVMPAAPRLLDGARRREIRFESSEMGIDGDVVDLLGGLTVGGTTLCVVGLGSIAGPDRAGCLWLAVETVLDRRQFGFDLAPELGYQVRLEAALRLCYVGSYTPHGYTTQEKREMTHNREYIVEGMTCDHCVLSVREEVGEVPGVEDVDVELASGRLLVTGGGFEDDAVRAAVAEAGYAVA